MWCTFASQQLKLKRQSFFSYHLFSAICPPLSGMLPGNISPGFDITYFPITANRSSQNEPFLTEGGGGKISVLIWMWMKRRINKWPRSSSWNPNGGKKDEWWTGAHISLNVWLLLCVFDLCFLFSYNGFLHLLSLSHPPHVDSLFDNKQSSEDWKMLCSFVSWQQCLYLHWEELWWVCMWT